MTVPCSKARFWRPRAATRTWWSGYRAVPASSLVSGSTGEASEWTRSRRKVLVAARDIPAGKTIEEEDLTAKRPGNLGGINPMQYIHLVGATARQDIAANSVLEFELFENIRSAPYKFPPIDEYRTSAAMNGIRGA